MAWFEPGKDPSQPWVAHPISPPSEPGREVPGTRRFSHGLGAGDLNGDGRLDVLCTDGWWEQPARLERSSLAIPPRSTRRSRAHMQVLDLNGDGRADVVSSSAHNYGIWSYLQRPSVPDNAHPTFEKVDLFPHLVSQTHSLLTEDLDGDGLKDLVTGKRFWAHGPKGDPGSDEPANLYWLRASAGPTAESPSRPTSSIPVPASDSILRSPTLTATALQTSSPRTRRASSSSSKSGRFPANASLRLNLSVKMFQFDPGVGCGELPIHFHRRLIPRKVGV